MDEPHKHHTNGPVTKRWIMCDSSYMKVEWGGEEKEGEEGRRERWES
jgi:hypothetical protein